MKNKPYQVTDKELLRWIEESIRSGRHAVARGHQGSVYLYQDGGTKLIIKAAPGWGLMRWLRQRMLRREHEVYSRLTGVQGIPRCYGLLFGRFLLLEYIDGVIFRHAEFAERDRYFEDLHRLIVEMHARGIAHTDLKRKENILVTTDEHPYLIDLGMAIIRRDGFHPVNHYLFDFGCKIDLNAWAKHKYRGEYRHIEGEDLAYFNPSRLEWIGRIRPRYRHFINKELPDFWRKANAYIAKRRP